MFFAEGNFSFLKINFHNFDVNFIALP